MIAQIRRNIALAICPRLKELWDVTDDLVDKNRVLQTELAKERALPKTDPKDIMRELLGAIPLNVETMNDVESGMTEAQRKNLHLWGYQLAQTEEWKHVRAFSLNKHAAKTLQEMLKNERHAWFGGGVLNGIMFLDELVEALSAAYEQDMQPEEAFDANSIIQD